MGTCKVWVSYRTKVRLAVWKRRGCSLSGQEAVIVGSVAYWLLKYGTFFFKLICILHLVNACNAAVDVYHGLSNAGADPQAH